MLARAIDGDSKIREYLCIYNTACVFFTANPIKKKSRNPHPHHLLANTLTNKKVAANYSSSPPQKLQKSPNATLIPAPKSVLVVEHQTDSELTTADSVPWKPITKGLSSAITL